jgi:hypothetical protein
MSVKVPLWLALALKETTKCDIQCPEWMTAGEFCCKLISCWLATTPKCYADSLRDALDFERENPQQLFDLPSFYVEMATLLLDAYVCH